MEFLSNLAAFANLAQILTGFGLVTVLLAILKRNAERRCWRNFKAYAHDWIDRLRATEKSSSARTS